MVEVIKHGEKNIVECNFCGALLRYLYGDIKMYEDFISPRESELKEYINCPDCKNKVIIHERNQNKK